MGIALLQENRFFLTSFLLGSFVTMAICCLIFYLFRKNSSDRTLELKITIDRLSKENNELKATEKKLKVFATTDMMTGLMNRATGFATLEQQLLLSRRHKCPLTVCFIDIDDLKQVNDNHGHRVGDNLIISVANILRAQIRESDIVSRIGGDEYLVVFPKCTIADAKEVWQRVLEEIKEFNNGDIPYRASLSHGFSQFSPDDPSCPSTVDALIEAADIDMYRCKK